MGEIVGAISKIVSAGVSGSQLIVGIAVLPVSIVLIGVINLQRVDTLGVTGPLWAFLLAFLTLLPLLSLVSRRRDQARNPFLAALWRSALIVVPLLLLCLPMPPDLLRAASIPAAIVSGLLYLLLLFYWPQRRA